jgi:molybdate transport system substrate-binding protein
MAAFVAATGFASAHAQAAPHLTVFAPPALERSVKGIDVAFAEAAGGAPALTIAPSAQLEHLVEQGARPDVIITTKRRLDQLSQEGLVRSKSRESIGSTRLVLVERKDSNVALRQIYPGLPLGEVLGPDGKIAMPSADRSVAGSRAMTALIKLGGWLAIASKIIPVDTSRQALNAVDRGQAVLAVAYESDARTDPTIRILSDFPADTNATVDYCAAAGARSRSTATNAFLAFLRGPKATDILTRDGFRVSGPDRR